MLKWSFGVEDHVNMDLSRYGRSLIAQSRSGKIFIHVPKLQFSWPIPESSCDHFDT